MAISDSTTVSSVELPRPTAEPSPFSASRIAGIYLIVGIVWIGLSDLTLVLSGGLTGSGILVSVGKGIVFVLLSTGLVYWLCRNEYRSTVQMMSLLRAVVEGTTDAVFVKDRNGRYLLINAAAASFINRKVTQVLGRDDRELFNAEEAERLMANDRAIMDGGKVVTIEETLTSGGDTRMYHAIKAPYFDATGSVIGVIGISRNITDRTRVESALRETEARLREAQRIARMGSWSWEPQTNQVWWSEAEFELFGAAPTTVQPSFEAFLAFLHPDDRSIAIARVEAMQAGKSSFANDMRVVRCDGTCIWIRSQARATRNANGEILRVEGTDQDITAQRLAQEAACESEERLQAAVEVAGLGVINIDYEKDSADLSSRAAEQFGFSQGAKASRSDLHSRFHAEESEFLKKQIDAALNPNGSGCFALEHRVVRPDGTTRWLNVRKQITFEDGRPQRAVLVTADVTDRKRSEAELRASEERYRMLFDSNPHPMWVYDVNTFQFLEVNGAAIAAYGYTREEFLASTIRDIRPAEDIHLLEQTVARTERGLSRASHWRHRRKDGTIFDVDVSSHDLPGDHSHTRLVLALDITDRKRAEAELQAIERRLRLALESAGAIAFVWEIPSDTVTRYFSKEPALPITNARVSGLAEVRARIHPEDLPAFDARLSACLAEGTEYYNEYRVVRADGTSVNLEEYGFLDRAANGDPLFLTGMVLDVTDRVVAAEAVRTSEARLRQAQKMEAVGRLAGGVAHDFNNLLTVINVYSELLLAGLSGEDPARVQLAAIHDAGVRASRLTKQLLALSRNSIVEPRLVNLNELVAESFKLFRRLIGEDIVLIFLPDSTPVHVLLDPGQLEQVLMNLALNARDAMPKGGQLTIETGTVELGPAERAIDKEATGNEASKDIAVKEIGGKEATNNLLPPGRYASLRVTDTGCGMSAAVRDKIFEPFYTTKGVGKGTGLGLAVVHGVVQQSGGAITVDSTVDIGTTFNILLPIATSTTREATLSETTVGPRGGETVLIVEDEDAVREVVRVALEGQGYSVLAASGGKQALELLQTHHGDVDLLVTDVIMPGMSGRELAAAARLGRPSLRVLYMSGYTDDAIDRHGVHGAVDQVIGNFIQKPFTPLGLARRVRTILDQPNVLSISD